MNRNHQQIKINVLVRRRLLIVILIAGIVLIPTIVAVQTVLSAMHSINLIESSISDVEQEMNSSSDTFLLGYTDLFMEKIGTLNNQNDVNWFSRLVKMNDDIISEIFVTDNDGIVRQSCNPAFVGYDLKDEEAANGFFDIQKAQMYISNDYQESLMTGDEDLLYYVSTHFPDQTGFLIVGFSEDNIINYTYQNIRTAMKNRRIGNDGALLVLDPDFSIIGSTDDIQYGEKFEFPDLISDDNGEEIYGKINFNGVDSYVVVKKVGDTYIVGTYPLREAHLRDRLTIISMLVVYIILMVCLFFVLSNLLDRKVVQGVEMINTSLLRITSGDLDERVDVRSSLEFSQLSDGINQTVGRLKEFIEEAKARIDKELNMARIIQHNALPNVKTVLDKTTAFGMYASMDAAKTVGGDFYDFYYLGDDILVILIADVSDKGIPAAMFMMRAKALMKSYAAEGMSVDELVKEANQSLWENNEGSMFVTAWIGFVNLKTGLVEYVHAGHTCPELISDGKVSMVKQKRNFIIGGRPNCNYLRQEFQMKPGDTLYLYTDGVSEAFNDKEEEYGNERLESILLKAYAEYKDEKPNEFCKKTCLAVRRDVEEFADGMAQSDDITMLCFKYMV
ncbi:MAG: SpoIIE family protein phosphatase [Lachnospiraceae bacterium]|nr:SpoIIE family protein phosphatase [Lachnospiraceae bacterium]